MTVENNESRASSLEKKFNSFPGEVPMINAELTIFISKYSGVFRSTSLFTVSKAFFKSRNTSQAKIP